MANKPLVIDSRTALNGVLNKWETLDNIQSFTRDIITPELDEKADKSAIVSGIPTVFARSNMFSLALNYSGDSMANTSKGLIAYYDELIDEWKGLIACLALDSRRLTIKRIDLSYSDGKSIDKTENLYETKGAFGNMLFMRKPLWTEHTGEPGEQTPFLNVIKYNDQVVGGTSPESLLFTAPSYSIPFNEIYAPKGKFRDPIKHGKNLNETQWRALQAYVENLIGRLRNVFTPYYQDLDESLRPNYDHIAKRLEAWLEEIKTKIKNHEEKAYPNSVEGFTKPFSFIFNYSDSMFGSNGVINSQFVEGYTEFKAEDLLLKRGSEIARVLLEPSAEKQYSKFPLQLLQASIIGSEEGEKAYFALPLSVTGLKIFGSSISALLSPQQDNTAIKTRMRAEYDESSHILYVNLTINTEDNQIKPVQGVYTVKPEKVIDSDILIWPNFISSQWNKYFLYSEMPSTSTNINYNAIPFVGEQKEGNFVPVMDDAFNPVYLCNDEDELRAKGIDSKMLVTADHRVVHSPYKYEIYQSNKPFSGVKLTCGKDREGNEKLAGFLLIRYASSGTGDNMLPENLMEKKLKLDVNVTIGFDFGSTNSSVAYFDPINQSAEGFEFENRRVSLFNKDRNRKKYQYLPKDFFFFSKEPTPSNALKSVLAIHDQIRLPSGDNGLNVLPVSGGIPCFMSNLPIKSVTANTIDLEFGPNLTATLINNMKWSDSDVDKNYKAAYLRTVLLMAYAELFMKGLKPIKLNWSYPSTMERNRVLTQYDPIWKSLSSDDVCPILSEDGSKFSPLEVTGIAQQELEKGLGQSQTSGDGKTIRRGFGLGLRKDAEMQDDINSSLEEGENLHGWRKKKPQQTKVQEVKVIDLSPDKADKVLYFSPIDTRYPMTEACASANYTAQKSKVKKNIVYCFDVGGSTTDISAIFALDGKKSSMIKQNSVRFAAQKISQAISQMSNEFGEVLKKVCKEFDIQLIGFNQGPSRYDDKTASYYYEQVVDMLNNEQLKYFYSCIAEKCPRLFAVNMYVTGLIMYYAGQLYVPLGDAIFANKKPGFAEIQGVEFVFEGKGARIFDWLCTKDMSNAELYFREMFKAGVQSPGIPEEEIVEIEDNEIDLKALKLEGKGDNDVKFEVSKGLAAENGVIDKPDEAFEIFGENGFKGYDDINGKVYTYRFDTKLSAEWMGEMGGMIRQPKANCDCFTQFLDIYGDAVQQVLGIVMDIEEMRKGLDEMEIEQYITQELPRFKEAMTRHRANQPFDYVAPIIIIEGLKFYDKHLLKCFMK